MPNPNPNPNPTPPPSPAPGGSPAPVPSPVTPNTYEKKMLWIEYNEYIELITRVVDAERVKTAKDIKPEDLMADIAQYMKSVVDPRLDPDVAFDKYTRESKLYEFTNNTPPYGYKVKKK